MIGNINECQKIQLERIRLASFNGLDGDKVARSLAANRNLWTGFVFGRFKYNELIELRDISQDSINADTLMVLTTKDKWPEIEKLAQEWDANEYGYIDSEGNRVGTHCYDKKEFWSSYGASLENNEIVVRIWWD